MHHTLNLNSIKYFLYNIPQNCFNQFFLGRFLPHDCSAYSAQDEVKQH